MAKRYTRREKLDAGWKENPLDSGGEKGDVIEGKWKERSFFFLSYLAHKIRKSDTRLSPMVTIMALCKNESLFLVFPDSSIRNGLSVCVWGSYAKQSAE